MAVIDHAEYELIFDATGAVELLSQGEQVWTSDADDDFADEFEGDLFTGEDAEEILEYLEEAGLIPEGAEVDIVEYGESEETDDDEQQRGRH